MSGSGPPRRAIPTLPKRPRRPYHRILKGQPLKPHKITYYLERKDPEFDRKMREVLMGYQEVTLGEQKTSDGPGPGHYGQNRRETRRSGSGNGSSGPFTRLGETFHRVPGLRVQALGNSGYLGCSGP